jgi:hypothetical protein
MPPLPGSPPPPAPRTGPYRVAHPLPGRGSLELMSGRERMWWGRRFGLDTPYLATFSGWGELVPLYGANAFPMPVDLVQIIPPPQFTPEGGGGNSQDPPKE